MERLGDFDLWFVFDRSFKEEYWVLKWFVDIIMFNFGFMIIDRNIDVVSFLEWEGKG